MTPLRFQTKLALAAVLSASLTLAAAFWGVRVEIREAIVHSHRGQLRTRARRTARRMFEGDALRSHAAGFGARAFLPDGTPFPASASSDGAPDIPDWLVAVSVERLGRPTTETLSGSGGADEFRVLAEHFLPRRGDAAPGTEHGLVVVTYYSLAGVDDQADVETLEALVKALPPALIATLLSAILLARSFARPLSRMAEEAEVASSLEGDAAVTGSGAGDELDSLARVLNAAFARLRSAFARQSRFTADAAHELRTPVSAILGRSDVALRRERSPDEYRAALRDVREVAARAAQTVEALLHLARLDARDEVEQADVDLVALVRREVSTARHRDDAPDDAVRFDAEVKSCHVVGDEALLTALFRNVLENALTHGRSDRGVDVRLRRDGASAVVVIDDHGEGVPSDHVAIVFDRMHRVDMARSRGLGGAGLGLSIVRAVAEAHGGSATLASSPGAGTTVTVELPACD